MPAVRKIDTSLPVRRNVDEFNLASAHYAVTGDGPDMFNYYARNVVVTAVAYAEGSTALAADLLGVKKVTANAMVNQMRKPTPTGKERTKGQCLRGHDLTNPDNVWVTKTGSRSCKICPEEKRKELYPDA